MDAFLDDINLTDNTEESEIRPLLDDPQVAEKFIVSIGKAFQISGMNVHVLEFKLTQIAECLGIDCSFFLSPAGTFYSFGMPDGRTPGFATSFGTHFGRVLESSFSLEKLLLLERLSMKAMRNQVTLQSAIACIDEIMHRPPRHGLLWYFISYIFAAIGVSYCMGGGWREIVATVAISVVTWSLSLFHRLHLALPTIASTIAGIIACLFYHNVFKIDISLVVLSGVIKLTPGIALGMGMVELATGHFICGVARLAYSLLVQFQIAYGMILSTSIMSLIYPPYEPWVPSPPHAAYFPLMAGLVGLSLCIDLQYGLRQIPIALITSYLGAATGVYLIPWIGELIGTLIGATAIAMVSNIYAVFVPPHVPTTALVPGVLLLVPAALGSLGFFTAIQDVLTGTALILSMSFIVLQLVIGILIANTVLPVRGAYYHHPHYRFRGLCSHVQELTPRNLFAVLKSMAGFGPAQATTGICFWSWVKMLFSLNRGGPDPELLVETT